MHFLSKFWVRKSEKILPYEGDITTEFGGPKPSEIPILYCCKLEVGIGIT